MLCEAANSAPSSPSPSPAVDGDLSSGVASPAPPVVASNGPPEPTGTGTGTGVGTPSRGSRWAAAARRAHAVRGGTALATARHAPEDQALCTSCHATAPPSTSASLCQPICLRSLFGWQVVYKNQPPGAADPAPAPPTPGTGAGAGLGSGSVLGATLQPWQQLLQQRPVLTMMEQNIAAIASGIGRIASPASCGAGAMQGLHSEPGCCCDAPVATRARLEHVDLLPPPPYRRQLR